MGKKYSAEFRNMVVQLHLNNGKSIEWVADEYDVSASTIGRWINVHKNREQLDAKKTKVTPFDNT